MIRNAPGGRSHGIAAARRASKDYKLIGEKVELVGHAARTLASLGVLLSTAAAVAQDLDEEEDLALIYGDEESVSIATGSSKPIRLAPSVASVITAKEIRALGATHLEEVLETVPGLHVSRSSNRLNALYSIRGIHTDENPQVLMLKDGVPLTELFTGGRAPTFRLPPGKRGHIRIEFDHPRAAQLELPVDLIVTPKADQHR